MAPLGVLWITFFFFFNYLLSWYLLHSLHIYTKSGWIRRYFAEYFYQHCAFHSWFVFSSELVNIMLGQLARCTVQLSWRTFESGFLFQTLRSGLRTWDFKLQTLDSRLQTPDSRLKTPDSRLQTPDSRLQTPTYIINQKKKETKSGVYSLESKVWSLKSQVLSPERRVWNKKPDSKDRHDSWTLHLASCPNIIFTNSE